MGTLADDPIHDDAWRELRGRWPVAGFQRRLLQLTIAQARKHPLRPLPMLRW